jgi:hypothetical protein
MIGLCFGLYAPLDRRLESSFSNIRRTIVPPAPVYASVMLYLSGIQFLLGAEVIVGLAADIGKEWLVPITSSEPRTSSTL